MMTFKVVRKIWIDKAIKILLAEFSAYKSETQMEALKDQWQQIFGNLPITDPIAERAATLCIASYDKWPTTRQFGDMLTKARKEKELELERKKYMEANPNRIDSNLEIMRLVNETSIVASLIKKIDYPNVGWADGIKNEIAKKINQYKKMERRPGLSELDVIISVKKMCQDELRGNYEN